jgi:hypothetical protein
MAVRGRASLAGMRALESETSLGMELRSIPYRTILLSWLAIGALRRASKLLNRRREMI